MEGSTNNLADPFLLETIDKLFEHNIGDSVSLPQLLVVGDQSSGKSSVLEGLTNLPFPRDSGLCTRFATQITFRRTSAIKIAVSIIPSANAESGHVEKLRSWKKNDLQFFSRRTFADILIEVNRLMGIGNSTAPSGGTKTFSDDVLKIEICGPSQQHLSVIDVPGIFKKTTAGMTTKSDIEVVRNMVITYMKNPRSVILAVIPANVDIANQEILEMADECDKQGERTLGVLTKPDLVDRGAENRIVDLIEGRGHKLKLGWSIVRNPGQMELEDSKTDRHAVEKDFFKTKQPWAKLNKNRVGIQSLQGRLREILTEKIRNEFPNVKSDITKKLNNCKKQLEALGPCRETRQQQHDFLLDLAMNFQRTTSLALEAHYGGDDVFDSLPSLKLATAVVDRNAVFAEDVWKRGHTMKFSQGVQQAEETNGDTPGVDSKEMAKIRYNETQRELEDLLHEDRKLSEPKPTGIISWLEKVYRSSRGFELGTFDSSLLPIIWKKQSANWDDLALGYISDIVILVHGFTVDLLSAICEDQRVRAGLTSVLMDGLIERYKQSIDHVQFILFVERVGTPITTNHYFIDNLKKCRQERLKALMQKQSFEAANHGTVVKLDSILTTSTSSNLEHTICDLHDILKSYYKVARKRFVDVVCMQAADFHLVTGPATPVRLFSPVFVSQLKEEQLERIAGEDVSTRRHRAELRREIENLENGKKILI
ncbi:hypothetical protein MMC28_008969 [Mycoblastus sanguinarius]|nr:hypothetical protein [Mycoblastus sanguinarius]